MTKDRVILILVIIVSLSAIGLILFFKVKPDPGKPIVTTITKTDTVERLIQGTAPQIQPIIIKSDAASPVIIPPQYQTLPTDVKELSKEVKDLAAQLYAVNHYDNSIKLKDDSGKEVGEVNMKQDVTENKLQPFTPTYKLSIPVVTNTTTTTIKEPYKPVNQVYLGAGIIGNQIDLVNAFKAGILLKNKKDNVIEINATINKGMLFGGEIGFYKKISFKRKSVYNMLTK